MDHTFTQLQLLQIKNLFKQLRQEILDVQAEFAESSIEEKIEQIVQLEYLLFTNLKRHSYSASSGLMDVQNKFQDIKNEKDNWSEVHKAKYFIARKKKVRKLKSEGKEEIPWESAPQSRSIWESMKTSSVLPSSLSKIEKEQKKAQNRQDMRKNPEEGCCHNCIIF